MKNYTIRNLLEFKEDDLLLSLVSDEKTLDNPINFAHLNRPGLALAGFLDRFSYDRIQVLGETEVIYLQSLSEDELYEKIKDIYSYSIPCLIVSKGLTLPYIAVDLANNMNIAILSSRLSTIKLYNGLSRYLNNYFASEKTIHGTLVDVFGAGVLLTGKSGIGKSECALDLVTRGHGIVTDDTVTIKVLDDALVGMPPQKFGHFMEIRGVGIINIEKMFGIQRVRFNHNIELQIELMPWKDNFDYERLGLVSNWVEHLGVNIPVINLPVSPGKNVSVIIEVAVMNYILKKNGYHAAEDYAKILQEEIKRKTKV
ncbi:MAG: HPr(Ser) kinase/phosphatase [Candidatus Zophobacter franzmannii]|nr:HPr(Ser) kinase/phosphatase [Candidatus Zophobacter franzmannii]